MDVYVSLEATVEKATEYCTDDDGSCSKAHTDLRELLDDLENLPAADVRPVVLCKDCVHRGDGEEVDDSCWCYETCQIVSEDDFCSHGKRREENKQRRK